MLMLWLMIATKERFLSESLLMKEKQPVRPENLLYMLNDAF